MLRAGQLPFGLGFHSDHRGIFADLDGEHLLKLHMTEPVTREPRRLSSKNNKHRELYITHLSKHLEAHNVYQRVGELGRSSQNGKLTPEQLNEYNKLVDCITDGMLTAER